MPDTRLSERIKQVDPGLLLFLCGVTYVKLYIKVAAVLCYIVYLLAKKHAFRKPAGINSFYFLIAIAGTVSAFIQHSFSDTHYIVGYALGLSTWMIAGVSSYLLYTSVAGQNINIPATIKAFFAVNMIISFFELINLMLLSGHLMPYWYWEKTEYFGASTGDHIHGIFSSNSVTNAMVSVLGIIYFLYRQDMKWAIACLVTCLLCTSNLSLMILACTLGSMFLFAKKKALSKSVILMFFLVLIIYPILSPFNIKYISSTYSRGTSQNFAMAARGIDTVTTAKTKEQVKPRKEPNMEDNLNGYITNVVKQGYYTRKENHKQLLNYTTDLKYLRATGDIFAATGDNVVLAQPEIKKLMTKWYANKYDDLSIHTYYRPLKFYSAIQTLYFLKEKVKNAVFGAGMGNFSSKLAIKMTGLNLQGSYPAKYIYIDPDFAQHHFYTLLYVFSLPVSEHSTVNMPNSIYNQIAGEYGIIGIGLFIVFYIGFFYKYRSRLSFGYYLLFATLAFFGFEYWFEMLSLTIVFELLMLQDIFKTTTEENAG